VIVGIRPSSIRLGPAGIAARVDLIENLGDALLVDLRLDDNIIRARVGTICPVARATWCSFQRTRRICICLPRTPRAPERVWF